ncbi:MAG: acetyl-CoA carboxylase biotin carboxyl carrier protein subunit [Planctomycetota bacterium]|nr:acetyl-CoA carboxylase biotin carboxyl carrier protein subunit [Planctomycetota bacterium]
MGVPKKVTVPIVGKVVRVLAKPGDRVAENDEIATIEAMKMEMPIVAPVSGVLKEISIQPGQVIQADTVIAIIEQ